MPIDIYTWKDLPEGRINKINDSLFVAKIYNSVILPKSTIAFEDSNLKIESFSTDNKILGYFIYPKKVFNILVNNWYVSFIDPTIISHHNPVTAYKDVETVLRKFNTPQNYSYWFVIRERPK